MATYWPLVESVWDSISIYEGPEQYLAQFGTSDSVSRTLFAAHWCQSEVQNGGLHQFFWNSTGVLAPEAAAAFDTLGMPQTARVIRNAMAWFGSTYPRDREQRMEVLDNYEAENPDEGGPFKQLDDQFFDLVVEEGGGFEHAANKFSSHRAA